MALMSLGYADDDLIFTNGIAVWDDTDILTNARQRCIPSPCGRFDEDGLTDGGFRLSFKPGTNDTDGTPWTGGCSVWFRPAGRQPR